MTEHTAKSLEAWHEMERRLQTLDGLREINADLLAALEEYLDWHEANFVLPSGNFEDPDQMTLAKKARAAIAKAKGE